MSWCLAGEFMAHTLTDLDRPISGGGLEDDGVVRLVGLENGKAVHHIPVGDNDGVPQD